MTSIRAHQQIAINALKLMEESIEGSIATDVYFAGIADRGLGYDFVAASDAQEARDRGLSKKRIIVSLLRAMRSAGWKPPTHYELRTEAIILDVCVGAMNAEQAHDAWIFEHHGNEDSPLACFLWHLLESRKTTELDTAHFVQFAVERLGESRPTRKRARFLHALVSAFRDELVAAFAAPAPRV